MKSAEMCGHLAAVMLIFAAVFFALAAVIFVKLRVRDALRDMIMSTKRERGGGSAFRIIERRLITFDGEERGDEIFESSVCGGGSPFAGGRNHS